MSFEIKKNKVVNDLQKEIDRFCLISVKKLFNKHKDKIIKDESLERIIKDELKNILDNNNSNIENHTKINKLNDELQELEVKKFDVSFNKLTFKAIEHFSLKYENVYDLTTIRFNVNKSIDKIKRFKFTILSFRKYHNISNKKYYAKKVEEKENRKVMNNTEKAKYLAELKRNKSINIIKECLELLKDNNEKTTANNVKRLIDEKYESCLAIRQIKTYMKELKDFK